MNDATEKQLTQSGYDPAKDVNDLSPAELTKLMQGLDKSEQQRLEFEATYGVAKILLCNGEFGFVENQRGDSHCYAYWYDTERTKLAGYNKDWVMLAKLSASPENC